MANSKSTVLPSSKGFIIAINVLSLIIGFPVAAMMLLLGGFAGDSGSNYTTTYLLTGASAFVALGVLACIFLSHRKRSIKIAAYGILVPFVPTAILFVYLKIILQIFS